MSQLRIQLSWRTNKREARVLKSPHLRESSTFYQITVKSIRFIDQIRRITIILQDDGIRDIDENEMMDQDNCPTASQENIYNISNN